eukprot:3052925-Lingulodinium_polyedra.AAC.1
MPPRSSSSSSSATPSGRDFFLARVARDADTKACWAQYDSHCKRARNGEFPKTYDVKVMFDAGAAIRVCR